MRHLSACPLAALIFLLAFAGGCTHNYRYNLKPTETYPATDRIDLAVELRLTDEFSSYYVERKMMGDSFRMHFGPALADNSERMSRALFRDVQVVRGAADATGPGVQAVLTPTVVKGERVMGMTNFSEGTISLAVEWALTTPSGRTIWVGTGEGTGKGTNFGVKKQEQGTIDTLFLNSFDLISTAPEVRSFAPAR